MGAQQRLEELGLELPFAPAPAAAYQPWAQLPDTAGGLVFTAGQLPVVDGTLPRTGKLGADLDTEEGAALARTAALNVLAVAAAAFGDLDRVRVVKVTVFVASSPDFTEQHLVANGASQLLADVLGNAGVHARSAVGVPVLPMDSPVEVEAILTAR
ncbi:RidA family protein [Egicoccus sp. AB-alg6-2]|uniref:RidA family protein n=1 Tax=Egicoccus sp. AB-alg6-2 TaxID=3242692 RepID=UPI00359E457A